MTYRCALAGMVEQTRLCQQQQRQAKSRKVETRPIVGAGGRAAANEWLAGLLAVGDVPLRRLGISTAFFKTTRDSHSHMEGRNTPPSPYRFKDLSRKLPVHDCLTH